MLAFLLAACGGGDCPRSRLLTAEELQLYAEVEACSRMSAPPPRLVFLGTAPCPTSGKLCCLAGGQRWKCGEATCQEAAHYRPSCGTVELPERYEREREVYMGECSGAGVLKHEFLHHILSVVKSDPDGDHGRPEWAQCRL